MKIFKTDRPNATIDIIKKCFNAFCIFILPIIYDTLFPGNLIKDTYYYGVLVLLVMRLVDELSKERLRTIKIDTENRQIEFIYQSAMAGKKRQALSFDNARLEIAKRKSVWTWIGEPLTLYFLKNKMEIFKINNSKDGFSIDTLNQICKTVEEIPLPIVNV